MAQYDQATAWFYAVDQDRSGQLSAIELQQALSNDNYSHFKVSTCQSMISMFDRDFSGTINLQEFQGLWGYIQQWRGAFNAYDRDRSGSISANELGQALAQMGYNLSPNFVNTAMWRYTSTGHMTFEDFINSNIMLRMLTDMFKQRDTQRNGMAQVGYDDFMCMAVSTAR